MMISGLVALALGACSIENKRVVDQQQPGTVVTVPPSDVQILARSQSACDSYGVPRGTAQFDRCVQQEFAARRPG